MSQYPENLRGGPDVSAFEAQFEGGEFAALQEEVADTVYLEKRDQTNAHDIDQARSRYDRAIEEADKPESPLDKLRHLHEAYSAALDLKAFGALPSEDILVELPARMTAMNLSINGLPPENTDS